MPRNNAKNVAKWRNKQKQLGLCVDCVEPAVPGLTRCAKHRMKHNEYSVIRNKKRAEQWRQNKRCTRCGTKLSEREIKRGQVTCINCHSPYIKETQYATYRQRNTANV